MRQHVYFFIDVHNVLVISFYVAHKIKYTNALVFINI